MNFVSNLLTMHNQFKIYHWQTQRSVGSYAQHIAFGTAYDDLTAHIDDFIEIFQGKRGIIMARNGFTIKLENLDDNPGAFIDEFIKYLTQNVTEALDPTVDTDLLNIRDEMLGILNQTKYRLMMK